MDQPPVAAGHNTAGIMDNHFMGKISVIPTAELDIKRPLSPASPPLSFILRRSSRAADSDAVSIASSSALSIGVPSILSVCPSPTAALSPTFTISSHEQHGWATPKLRSRTMSQASVESCGLVAPNSLYGMGGFAAGRPEDLLPPPQQQMGFAEISIPHRPKRWKQRQSWDSGYRSQMSGVHTRGNSIDGDVALVPTTPRQHQPDATATPHAGLVANSNALDIPEPSGQRPSFSTPCYHDDNDDGDDNKNDDEDEDDDDHYDHYDYGHYNQNNDNDNDKWVDVDESASDSTLPAEDTAGRVLNYTLDVALGLGAHDVAGGTACRTVVHNFISDLQWAVNRAQENDAQGQQPSRTVSSASNGSRSSRGSAGGRSKRKSRQGGNEKDGDDEGDDGARDRGGSDSHEPGPAKRAKLEPAVRMSCPYRRKNPLRFNVRDHRLCALTVFTDTAELRRHIQDCHKRPANLSQHNCPRCQVHFSTADHLRQHLLFLDGKLCTVVDQADADSSLYGPRGCINRDSAISISSSADSSSSIHLDPEDGIDSATAEKLRSKKGRVSDSVEVQWQKIWALLFPGSPVLSYEYCAVMEHYELFEKYRASLPRLRGSLSAIGLGERGLDSLSHILTNHLMELFEQCNDEGRRKNYRNRQPKANTSQQNQIHKRSSLRRHLNAAQRDSGFVDEDVLVLPETPALTSDAGSSPRGTKLADPSSASPSQPTLVQFAQVPPLSTAASAANQQQCFAADYESAVPLYVDELGLPLHHQQEQQQQQQQQYGFSGYMHFNQDFTQLDAGDADLIDPWVPSMSTPGSGGNIVHPPAPHDNTSSWVYGGHV